MTDVCEVIAAINIGEGVVGVSAAMKILGRLDEAGLIVVAKPNYVISVERGSGNQEVEQPPSKQKLSVVRDDN